MVSKNNLLLIRQEKAAATNSVTLHHKMYKQGKFWVTAGISMFALAIGLAATQGQVLADQVEPTTAIQLSSSTTTNPQSNAVNPNTAPNSMAAISSNSISFEEYSKSASVSPVSISSASSLPSSALSTTGEVASSAPVVTPSANLETTSVQSSTAQVVSSSVSSVASVAAESQSATNSILPDMSNATTTITYHDDTESSVLSTDSIVGQPSEKASYNASSVISSYLDSNYSLVSTDFPSNYTFGNNNESYNVHFVHKTNSWTDNKTYTRHIYYSVPDGYTGPDNFDQKVVFHSTNTFDLVTGTNTQTPYVTDNATFAAVKSPVIKGLAASIDVPEHIVQSTDNTGGGTMTGVTVTYNVVGSWQMTNPDGSKRSISYVNAPMDAKSVITPTDGSVVIPYIKGYVPSTDTRTNINLNNGKLKLIDPNDPTKGYLPPKANSNPLLNTFIVYIPEKQVATINFIDDDATTESKRVLTTLTENGQTNLQDTLNTKWYVDYYSGYGYELVDADYPTTITYDNDTAINQSIDIHFKHGRTPITDATKLNKQVTRTISYSSFVPGFDMPSDVTQTATFTRTGYTDNVTHSDIFTNWVSDTTEFPAVPSPVITGLVAMKNVAAQAVTGDDTSISNTIYYEEVGSWVVHNPDGSKLTVAYPNDPTDGTKISVPTDGSVTLPYVKGYHLVTLLNKELTLFDKNNPEKGYIPDDPGAKPFTDLDHHYAPDEQHAELKIIDDDATSPDKTLLDTRIYNSYTGQIGSLSTDHLIAYYAVKGYEPANNNYPTSVVYDNDDATDQVFELHLKHSTEPVLDTGKITRSITRTIQPMLNSEPAGSSINQTVTFNRTGITDKVTKIDTYTPWTSDDDTFKSVTFPAIDGYVPLIVDSATATPSEQNTTINVNYKKAGQNAFINYLDDNGNIVQTEQVHGLSGDMIPFTVDSSLLTKFDYVSSDIPDNKIVFDFINGTDQSFNVQLRYKTAISMVPNEPIVTSEASVPNEGILTSSALVPNYPAPSQDDNGSRVDRGSQSSLITSHSVVPSASVTSQEPVRNSLMHTNQPEHIESKPVETDNQHFNINNGPKSSSAHINSLASVLTASTLSLASTQEPSVRTSEEPKSDTVVTGELLNLNNADTTFVKQAVTLPDTGQNQTTWVTILGLLFLTLLAVYGIKLNKNPK